MGQLKVKLPDALLDELRKTVPRNDRSEFVAAALESKLVLAEQIQAAERAAGSWSDEGRGEVDEELRTLRSRWDRPVSSLSEDG